MHRVETCRKLAAILLLAGLALVGQRVPARADVTAFLGVTPTPSNHSVRGFSAGLSLLIVGFEFEVRPHRRKTSSRDCPRSRPGRATCSCRHPVEIAGTTFYGTAGAGGYSEALGNGSLVHDESQVATNVGGGARFGSSVPFACASTTGYSSSRARRSNSIYQRFYVGANLKF